MDRTNSVYISLRSSTASYKSEGVYFGPIGESLAWAVVSTVDGIQDHAIETNWGEPLPPCPGHVHPLVPRIVGGVPKWVCLRDGPEYYEQDILPGFDPAFETPEEYLLLRDRRG